MVRILMEANPKDSGRESFKILNVLPLASQYILSLALLMVTNKSLFRLNSEIHNFNTTNSSNFFQVTTDLTVFKKSPACVGFKMSNHLLGDIKSFKKALKISA
jgi:hypothetical protein